jgi:hypothetical protein
METKRSIIHKAAGRIPSVAVIVAAGVLAFGGLMTTGLATSNADTIQTEGTYPSNEACRDAGPGVKATTPGNWNNFVCVPDRTAAGQWRLVLIN